MSYSRFKGIQAWDYAFLIILYLFFFAFVFLLPKAEQNPLIYIWFSFAFVCFIFIFFLSRNEVLRNKLLSISGIQFIDGWIKTGIDCGEECLFGVREIRQIRELSPNERESFDRFMKKMEKLESNQLIINEFEDTQESLDKEGRLLNEKN